MEHQKQLNMARHAIQRAHKTLEGEGRFMTMSDAELDDTLNEMLRGETRRLVGSVAELPDGVALAWHVDVMSFVCRIVVYSRFVSAFQRWINRIYTNAGK